MLSKFFSTLFRNGYRLYFIPYWTSNEYDYDYMWEHGCSFFGYSFFYVLYRFIFPKNSLVINDRGIINQTNVLGSKENIPFETMKTAKLENIHGKQYIGIKLYNEEEYLDRLSVFKRI